MFLRVSHHKVFLFWSACSFPDSGPLQMYVRCHNICSQFTLQEEQKKAAAKTAVVPKDQEQAMKEGRKPQVISQDGDTIYIGFEKG